MVVSVRRASAMDAEPACAAVRASIIELCVADHQRDRDTLDARLANKTPDNFSRWIASAQHDAVVAVLDRSVVGFGLLNREGSLSLLYVAPVARFQGASTLMLQALEDCARSQGVATLTLNSTTTAMPFYRRRGYRSFGPPSSGFGVTLAHPMSRGLVV